MLALVTGATAGIGHAAARRLAAAGWDVLVHGRSERSSAEACSRIRREVPGANLTPVHADFASLAEVVALAARVPRLDGLVNNAGLFTPNAIEHERRVSADGYELHWAVNYLAAFALTTELAERTARVVNLSSGMQARATMRWDDPQHEDGWDRASAYGQSKLALTMFTMELAARSAGGMLANAVNPGYVDTRLVRETFGGARNQADDGARWVVRPLLDERLAGVTGCFLDLGERAEAHPLTADREARVRLWELSRSQVAAALRKAGIRSVGG
jgi:NAD(P)-dependent dehydrogenase (short-subunit alcohol dehydrogenase family)